jgi:hypothetical protein
MSVYLVPHNPDSESREAELFESVLDRNFKEGEMSETQVSMDWDGTMVEDDTGIQVFLQKLLDPHYWQVEDDAEFAKTLFPDSHLALYQRGAMELGSRLDKEKCVYALGLVEDIFHLYLKIKEKVIAGEFVERKIIQERMKDPVLSEFARKMIALDRVAMEMDSELSQELGGTFLLRTRFANKHSLEQIRDISKQVWEYAGQTVNLKVSKDPLLNGRNRRVSYRNPLLGQNAIERELCPTVDRRVYEMLHKVTNPNDCAQVRILTTNLQAIPEALIESSMYRRILMTPEQASRAENPLVHGSKLKLDATDRTLKAIDKGRPVHGSQKRESARVISRLTGNQTRIAMGDTPSGDLEMLLQAVKGSGDSYENGNGIAIVVPKGGQVQENPEQRIEETIQVWREQIRKRFSTDEAGLKELEQSWGDRFFYLMPKQAA